MSSFLQIELAQPVVVLKDGNNDLKHYLDETLISGFFGGKCLIISCMKVNLTLITKEIHTGLSL